MADGLVDPLIAVGSEGDPSQFHPGADAELHQGDADPEDAHVLSNRP
jgi:hypothetical protein